MVGRESPEGSHAFMPTVGRWFWMQTNLEAVSDNPLVTHELSPAAGVTRVSPPLADVAYGDVHWHFLTR